MPIKFAITGDNKGFLSSMEGVRNSVHTTMRDVEKEGMSVEQMFNRIKQAAALSFAGISAKELISDIMHVRGEFQQLEVAFKTILGSEQAATKLMDQLVKTAATTPFDLKGVADGAKMLLAYGTAVDDVNNMLVRLGDVAAGMSIPLNDLVYLYGTTMVQGRMFTQDLRQFQGRGIPIAEELAKVLHVATNEIGDMVTAGKVTGEVFHQAFMNMTGEGSKFGGLMAEQAKTIQGQISNIEDAVDMMFNQMGKESEGLINAGLSGVSYLVENWQKVGEAIGVAAVAIGSYKAVMIAVNAVQKVNNALMAESAVQSALAAAAGHTLTAAQARQAATEVMLTRVRQSLIVATKELAAATLMNPYVWAAAAITTMVVMTYKLVTAEDAETIARRRANDEMQKFADGLDEQKNKIEGYIQTLHDANATEYEKAVAWEMLNRLAPTLTEKYDKATLATIDLAKASKELAEENEKLEYENLQQGLEKYSKRLEQAKKAEKEYLESSSPDVNGIRARAIGEELAEAQAGVDAYAAKLAEIDRIRQQMIEDAKPIEIKIQEANDNARAKREIYNFYRMAADLAGELKEAHDIAEGTISNTSIPQDYDRIAENARQKYDQLIADLQKDVEDLRSQVAKSPADIKLQIQLQEKQKALEDILNMKQQWEVTGATTIPLFFQIHYTEAENALNEAQSGAKKGMRFDGPTGKWVPDEKTVEKKSAAQWKADAYKDWKSAEKKLDDYYKQKDQVDEATFKKKVEDLKSDVDEAKKRYQDYGGSTSTKGGKSNDAAKRRAAELQEGRRWQEQLQRLLEDARTVRSEATIASIRNEGEREREEQELNHKKALADIERQAEEMRKAVYEHNKLVWENAHKDGVYEDTAEGQAGWSQLALTKEQQDYISALLEKENAEYKEMVHQRYVDEAQAMYDYLKEYGTYEQQKLAITKEYEEKIKNARSKGERLTLTRQRDSRIAQANSQSLAMNIDWSQTFKGLGNILKDIASETLAKVNEYMRTDEYKNLSATDKKSYQELREKLMSAGGQEAASPFKTSTWADIAKYTEEYKQRVKDLMLASQTHREAVQRLEDAQRDLERATTVTGKAMAQHQVDMAKKWVDETAQQVENSDSEKDKAKEKLHTATDAASEGLENLNTVIGQLTQGSLTGFFNGVSNVIASLTKKTSDDMEGIVGIIGEKAGGIIGAILAIIDALGEDPAAFVDQILDKVASVIEAVISQIPEIIANVVSGAANIVGSVFEGIGNLFGLGGDNSAFEAAVDKWGWLLDSWKDNLEYEKELIEKAYGGDVLSIAGQSKEMLEKTMQAAREVYEGWAGSGAGLFSHSNGYEANRDAAWRYLFQSNPEIAKKLGISQIKINAGFGDMEFYDGEDISKLFGLDWKELEKLKHENSQFWQSLYEEARNYLDQYIEAGKAIEEMESQLNEKLTTTTKEGVFDDFLEQLYNLADGSETVFDDIAEAWKQMVNKMVINNIIANDFQEKVEQWYERLASLQTDRTNAEDMIRQYTEKLQKGEYGGMFGHSKEWYEQQIAYYQSLLGEGYKARLDTLSGEYNSMVKDAQEQIENLRDMGVIQATQDTTYKQEPSSKGFAAMSQDTGEELNGRFTALQISNEAISQQMIIAVASLSTIVTFGSNIDKNVAEIRGLVYLSTGYLEDVLRFTRQIYVKLGGSLEDIANNTKNL